MKVRFTGPTDSYHSIAIINKYICSIIKEKKSIKTYLTYPNQL